MLFLLIVLLQLIWSASYVAMKLSLMEMPVGLVLVLRYGIAALAFLAAGQLKLRPKFTRKEWALLLLVGVINFSGSPYFQLKGLSLTNAADASVLIAFEPIVTALLAVLILKEKLKGVTLITFLIATSGVLFMSGWQPSTPGTLGASRLLGDAVFFLSLLCEGTCTITAKEMMRRHNPFRLIAWMMLFGFAANLLGNAPLLFQTSWTALTLSGWGSVLYLSLLCSVFGYCGWVFLLQRMAVNHVALSLFLQPVMGIFLASAVLSEPINARTILGTLIVLSSLLVWWWFQTLGAFRRRTGMST